MLLAGPNGSGKTSFLAAFRFLQLVIDHDEGSVISKMGGPLGVRRAHATVNTVVSIGYGSVEWAISIVADGAVLNDAFGERVRISDVNVEGFVTSRRAQFAPKSPYEKLLFSASLSGSCAANRMFRPLRGA